MRRNLGLAASWIGEGAPLVPSGWLKWVTDAIALILTLVLAWYALEGRIDLHTHVAIFLLGILPLIFVTRSASQQVNRRTSVDFLLSVCAIAVCGYFVINRAFYDDFVEGVTSLDALEVGMGLGLVVLTIEACRRAIGLGLTLVVLVLLVYVAFGQMLQGSFRHDGIGIDYFVVMQTVTTNGIFGKPLQVCVSYAFMFVLFGTLYHRAGGGTLFFDVAAALAGRMVGGPAKVCVVSSGLYGSVSGSPVADVATTGPINIPLMKRSGISAVRAGAIEASASCGGAMLPPVMGAVAFLMAGFLGIPYGAVVAAAIVPGLLYYFGVFTLIHFDSVRAGDAPMAADAIVGLGAALRRGWFHVLPIAALIWLLVAGYSPAYIAAGSTLVVIAASWFGPNPITLRGLIEGASEAIRQMGPLTAACAAAGLVIGAIELTGLAGKTTLLLLTLSGGYLPTTLLVTAAVLILLGMGMPTPGVYVMGVALLAPVLITKFQIPELGTHMFLLYFACMSAVTPPVAVACFAAGAIAGANPMAVGRVACRVAFAGFALPFFFLFNEGILLKGGLASVAGHILAAMVYLLLLAAAIAGQGWRRPVSSPIRLMLAALAIAMIYPEPWLQAVLGVLGLLPLVILGMSRGPHLGTSPERQSS